MSEKSKTENEFYSGHFAKIVERASEIEASDLIFLMASYCLLGQAELAEDIFKNNPDSDVVQDSRANFFLGLGWTRLSQYKKAKDYFKKLHQKSNTDFDKFLLAQGMGFYNFFICRYEKAEKWIRKARIYLQQESHHPFWDLIYLDLSSNILVKRGLINLGIQQSRSALKVSRSIQNRFSEEAIEVSLCVFESIYGTQQKESLLQIEKLMKKYKSRSNFYYYNLSLEYVRRLNLVGDLNKSEKLLLNIQKSIFSSSLKRQKALWSFRFAHLLFLQGKPQQSLNQIESALDYLDERQDVSIQLQILGLKHKILSLNQIEDTSLIERIKRLTFYCQDSQALSYAYRYGWIHKPLTEDPHAQFFHSWKRQGHKNYYDLKKVVEKGWISLFVDLLPTDRQQFIYLDFLPKQALFFNQRQVTILSGLTHLLRQCLLVLTKGPISKKEFVQTIWGYEYEAYRHDNLIYTVVNRLRDFLKEHGEILILKDHTLELYQTKVRVYEHADQNFIQKSEASDAISGPLISTLNFRQIEILDFLDKNKYADIETIGKFLQISKMTAFRDLNGLIKLNKICRIGQARATRYTKLQSI